MHNLHPMTRHVVRLVIDRLIIHDTYGFSVRDWLIDLLKKELIVPQRTDEGDLTSGLNLFEWFRWGITPAPQAPILSKEEMQQMRILLHPVLLRLKARDDVDRLWWELCGLLKLTKESSDSETSSPQGDD